MARQAEFEEVDSPSTKGDVGILVGLARAELDQAIVTAKAHPRSLQAFKKEAQTLVSYDEEMAQSCIYSLPRKDENGKRIYITGPSARFAEVIQYAYGNNKGGGRVIAEEDGFIVAEGVYHDLEKNVSVNMQVRRRITDKSGRKFKADMVMVTGNAAASIAHRNAVLKGIPKAVWLPVYEAARKVALGEGKTMAERRAKAFDVFQKLGVSKEQIFARLDIRGEDDIGLEEIEILIGIQTAIREGGTDVDREFGEEREPTGAGAVQRDLGGVAEKVAAKRAAKATSNAQGAAPDHAATPVAENADAAPGASDEAATMTADEVTLDSVKAAMDKATTMQQLDEAYDLVSSLTRDDRRLATIHYHPIAERLSAQEKT